MENTVTCTEVVKGDTMIQICAHPLSCSTQNVEVFISLSNLIGCIAKMTFIQHPYHCPPGLDTLIPKIIDSFKKQDDVEHLGDFYFTRKHYTDIPKWLFSLLEPHQEFANLNLSANELSGKKRIQENVIVFSTRYATYCNKEDDFIDLDALVGNITWELYLSQIQ